MNNRGMVNLLLLIVFVLIGQLVIKYEITTITNREITHKYQEQIKFTKENIEQLRCLDLKKCQTKGTAINTMGGKIKTLLAKYNRYDISNPEKLLNDFKKLNQQEQENTNKYRLIIGKQIITLYDERKIKYRWLVK